MRKKTYIINILNTDNFMKNPFFLLVNVACIDFESAFLFILQVSLLLLCMWFIDDDDNFYFEYVSENKNNKIRLRER